MGLEGLCVIIMYFIANINILQGKLPEVMIEQWVKLKLKKSRGLWFKFQAEYVNVIPFFHLPIR